MTRKLMARAKGENHERHEIHEKGRGEMKERPIIMTAESVRAIAAGRKTQTRRVIKPQPVKDIGESPYYFYKKGNRVYSLPGQFRHFKSPKFTQEDDDALLGIWGTCPYGAVGDRLWVKENYIVTPPCWGADNEADYNIKDAHGEGRIIAYPATAKSWSLDSAKDYGLRTKSSMFMPRWASRITLEITNIRVERLQQISEDDAKAEGCDPSIVGYELGYLKYRAGYQTLWNSINAKRGYGWETNPWVWVIEFTRVK